MVKVSAFAWVPPFAQGLVRDLHVRWALEGPASPTKSGWSGRKTKRQRAIAACSHSGRCPLTKTANSSYSSPAPSSCTSQSIRWLPVSCALGLPL
jgi:hypothetical protein